MDAIKFAARIGGVGILIAIVLLGVTLYAAWGTITLLAPWVVAVFMVCLGLSAIVGGVAHIWIAKNRIQISNIERQEAAERSALGLEREKLSLLAQRDFLPLLAQQVMRGMALPKTIAGMDISAYPAMTAKLASQQLPAPAQSPPVTLLPSLERCDNILVVGKKGSGKTSLLQHLEAARLQTGKTVVLDSHAQPAQWRGHVIGIGRKYAAIRDAMILLTERMHKRFEKWSAGTSQFVPVSTIIDEFTLLPQFLRETGYNVQNYSMPALTEGRKVQMSCVWGVHSDKVKALGLEGASDLKECFDAVVYLRYDASTNERYAMVDWMNGDGMQSQRYAHPGPFVVHGQAQAAEEVPQEVALLEAPTPSILNHTVIPDAEWEAYQVIVDGGSKSAAYRRFYELRNGQPMNSRPNSRQIAEIDAIVARYERG